MVSMQSFANLILSNTAILALVLITGAGASSLTFPVGTVIGIKATAPRWVIFTCPVFSLPFSKTLSVTIEYVTAIKLIGFSLKFLATPIAIYGYSLVWATCIQLSNPLSHTLTITEVMFFDSTRGNTLFFAAPITLDNLWWILAFGAAIMVLFLIGVPRSAVKLLSTASACNHDPLLLGNLRTLATTKLSSFDTIWLKIQCFTTLLACKLNQSFRARQLLRRQFSPAFIRACKATPMLNLPVVYCMRLVTDWADFFKFHSSILAQML